MDLSPPKDLSHHYSRVLQRTKQSEVKRFYKYFFIPGIGNFAGGLPDPKYFPFDTLEAHVAPVDRFKPTPNDAVEHQPSNERSKHSKQVLNSHIIVPHDSPELDRNKRIDLASALQYGTSQGFPPLYQWIREFTRTKMHPNVPYRGGPEIVPTMGSTDGLSKLLHMFFDVWDDRKDWIRDRQGVLCEEFAFMAAIQNMIPRGGNVVPVAIDGEGMRVEGPGGLRDVLENWDRGRGKLPHLMYTVTVGQNPTSGTLSFGRKRQIYALCQKYDILIIEDDPYWFLQYPSAYELSMELRGQSTGATVTNYATELGGKSSGSAFLDSLVPSYLSIDTDGRVLRLDTFSKAVAPGCRTGWITAQPVFIERITEFTDLLTQQPSGFTQSMIAELILGQRSTTKQDVVCSHDGKKPKASWQMDGWIRWLEGLRGNYERRMQIISRILEDGKYKVTAQNEANHNLSVETSDDFEIVSRIPMFEFNFPTGGMFLWIRMRFENHPLFAHPKVTIGNLSLAFWVYLTTVKYRVLIAPGTMFSPTEKIHNEKGPFYFRICFAAVEETALQGVTHNYVQASNDFFDIDDPQVIDDIVKDA